MKTKFNVSFHIDWEERAKIRRKENKALKKRIKELTTSRDKWKEKAQNYQVKLKNALKSLKSLEIAFKKNFY